MSDLKLANKVLDQRLDSKEVRDRYKMSKTALYKAINNNAFPKPHHLAGGRRSYWWQSELLEYEIRCKSVADSVY